MRLFLHDVLNDDPEPILTVEPVTARVAEGGTLTWRLTMSAPSETPYCTRSTARCRC